MTDSANNNSDKSQPAPKRKIPWRVIGVHALRTSVVFAAALGGNILGTMLTGRKK